MTAILRTLFLAGAGSVALLAGDPRMADDLSELPAAFLSPGPAYADDDDDGGGDDNGDDGGGDDGGDDNGDDGGGDDGGGDDNGGDDGGGGDNGDSGDDGGDDGGGGDNGDSGDDGGDDGGGGDDGNGTGGDDDGGTGGAGDGRDSGNDGREPAGPDMRTDGAEELPLFDANRLSGPAGVFDGPSGREYVFDEVVLLAPQEAALQRLAGLGFQLRQRAELDGLGLEFARLGLPAGIDFEAGLAIARAQAPGSVAQANFGYDLAAAPCNDPGCYGWPLIGWAPPPAACGSGLTVGVVDTAVDDSHPALSSRRIGQRSFRSVGIAAPSGHGTAVASIIAGDADGGIPGMLPGVAILAAEVFHLGVDGRVRAIATDIAGALDWMAQERVPVANISIAGPDSPLLAQAVRRLAARGTLLVAAAGNNGPSAPPAFPAGYEEVIAVTAVDRHRRPYRLANRGPHLAFAAPGVEVWAAAGGDDGGTHTGTSFAAAYATAIIADAVAGGGSTGRSQIEARLAAAAVDLGAPGRDPVFGAGLVQALGACRE